MKITITFEVEDEREDDFRRAVEEFAENISSDSMLVDAGAYAYVTLKPTYAELVQMYYDAQRYLISETCGNIARATLKLHEQCVAWSPTLDFDPEDIERMREIEEDLSK